MYLPVHSWCINTNGRRGMQGNVYRMYQSRADTLIHLPITSIINPLEHESHICMWPVRVIKSVHWGKQAVINDSKITNIT